MRYELNSYILSRRNSAFTGLMNCKASDINRLLKVLSWHLPQGAEESTKILSGQWVSWPRYHKLGKNVLLSSKNKERQNL
jgi:hypothetical protein